MPFVSFQLQLNLSILVITSNHTQLIHNETQSSLHDKETHWKTESSEKLKDHKKRAENIDETALCRKIFGI